MLTRRMLIASTAVLAAGCGGLDIPFPELGTPKATPLTWVSRSIAELNTGPGIASLIGYYAIPMRVFSRTDRQTGIGQCHASPNPG